MTAMRRVLLAAIAGAISLGFMVETPEMRRERDKQEHDWMNGIEKAYDLPALCAFLKRQTASERVVDGVSLSKSKTADKWMQWGLGLKCGDWSFSTEKPDVPEFTLTWVYEKTEKSDGTYIMKSVTLYCRRDSRTSFAFMRATRDEDEYVRLAP